MSVLLIDDVSFHSVTWLMSRQLLCEGEFEKNICQMSVSTQQYFLYFEKKNYKKKLTTWKLNDEKVAASYV